MERAHSVTIGFSPFTGEDRFRDLLQKEDGTGYLTPEKKSFAKATQDGEEFNLEFFMHAEDFAAPTLRGRVNAEDSWVILGFELLDQSGSASIKRTFDPYISSLERDHYMFGEHVLRPDDYAFWIEMSDASCDANNQNCSNEASLKYQITVRAIEPPIPGDANLDGKVAFDDFLILSANYFHEEWRGAWFEEISIRPT